MHFCTGLEPGSAQTSPGLSTCLGIRREKYVDPRSDIDLSIIFLLFHNVGANPSLWMYPLFVLASITRNYRSGDYFLDCFQNSFSQMSEGIVPSRYLKEWWDAPCCFTVNSELEWRYFRIIQAWLRLKNNQWPEGRIPQYARFPKQTALFSLGIYHHAVPHATELSRQRVQRSWAPHIFDFSTMLQNEVVLALCFFK